MNGRIRTIAEGGILKQRDWFEVGARLIGVWQVVLGLDEIVTYADVLLKQWTPAYTKPGTYLTHATAHLLIGLALMVSTAAISSVSYGTEKTRLEEAE